MHQSSLYTQLRAYFAISARLLACSAMLFAGWYSESWCSPPSDSFCTGCNPWSVRCAWTHCSSRSSFPNLFFDVNATWLLNTTTAMPQLLSIFENPSLSIPNNRLYLWNIRRKAGILKHNCITVRNFVIPLSAYTDLVRWLITLRSVMSSHALPRRM